MASSPASRLGPVRNSLEISLLRAQIFTAQRLDLTSAKLKVRAVAVIGPACPP
jgi:hypothetical protein